MVRSMEEEEEEVEEGCMCVTGDSRVSWQPLKKKKKNTRIKNHLLHLQEHLHAHETGYEFMHGWMHVLCCTGH